MSLPKARLICKRVAFISLFWLLRVVIANASAAPSLYNYTVGGHYFSLPWAYVGGKTQIEDSLLINADFPNFTGSYGKDDRHTDSTTWSGHLIIFVEPSKEENTLELRAERLIRLDGLTVSSKDRYQNGNITAEVFSGAAEHPRFKNNNIIIFKDEIGTTISILVCSNDTTLPYPGCKGEFLWGGLLIQIGFSEVYKNSWFDIKSGTVTLLQTQSSPHFTRPRTFRRTNGIARQFPPTASSTATAVVPAWLV